MNKVGTYAANVSVSGGNLNLVLASSTSGALVHTDYGAGRYQLPVGGYAEARISFPGDSSRPIPVLRRGSPLPPSRPNG